MEKCKNCDSKAVPGCPLCYECRDTALRACKSKVRPKLNRADGDCELRLSNDVYRSCGGVPSDE